MSLSGDREIASPGPAEEQNAPFAGMSPQELFGKDTAQAAGGPGQEHTFIVGGTGDRGASIYGDNRNNNATVVDYPASIVPNGGVQTHDQSVSAGEQALESQVRQYLDQNPGSHAKLTGFSLGAEVAGNVLQKLGRSGQYAGRIDGDLYGDPRRPGGLADGISDLPQLGITMGDSRADYGGIPVDQHYIPGDPIADYDGEDFAKGDLANAQSTLDGYFGIHPNYGPLINETLQD